MHVKLTSKLKIVKLTSKLKVNINNNNQLGPKDERVDKYKTPFQSSAFNDKCNCQEANLI